MTRENAIKKLPIIEAFAKGKVIQCITDSGIWMNVSELNIYLEDNTTFDEYRVKPEPREWYVCPGSINNPSIYETYEDATKHLTDLGMNKLIKVREVVE